MSIRLHRHAGTAWITGPHGVHEITTLTCGHCNRVFPVAASAGPTQCDPGGFCRVCMHVICSACCGQTCRTIERRLEEMEARDRVARACLG